MPRVVHFEIHADEPERACRFYTDVFGWQTSRWGEEEYWLATTGPDDQPGINGGIMKRRDPAGATYNTIDVPSIDEYAEKIIAAGGQQVVPKMEIGTIGFVAYFKDTEGNIFGVFQNA